MNRATLLSVLKSKRLWALLFLWISALTVAGLAPAVPERGEVPEYPREHSYRDLPLPESKPREMGLNPFDQPFLFEVQGTPKMSARQREKILWNEYHKIIEDLGDRVPQVEVDRHGTLAVVKVDGEPFATVLPQDCPDYHSELSHEQQNRLELAIAEQWANLIREDLADEAEMRSPQYLAAYPYIFAFLFLVALSGHILADLFSRNVLNTPGWSLKLLVWLVFLALTCLLHPVLKPLSLALGQTALKPVFLGLLIAAFLNVVYHIAIWALRKYITAYLAQRGESERRVQRLRTIQQGTNFLLATMTAVGGVAWFLFAIGLPLEQFLTGAGVAGIVIGVVGRDVLLDYFYGFSILTEDTFGLGDWIQSRNYFGEVVGFQLRATLIRGIDGALVTISNGELRTVRNHTRHWSFADFKIRVSYRCPPETALELLGEEVALLTGEWPEKILKEPDILGVQELTEDAMVLWVLVRTAPKAQWAVKRELNKRVLIRFRKEGYEMPASRHQVWVEGKGECEES
jgi:small conductance mechanosensitive channel